MLHAEKNALVVKVQELSNQLQATQSENNYQQEYLEEMITSKNIHFRIQK